MLIVQCEGTVVTDATRGSKEDPRVPGGFPLVRESFPKEALAMVRSYVKGRRGFLPEGTFIYRGPWKEEGWQSKRSKRVKAGT